MLHPGQVGYSYTYLWVGLGESGPNAHVLAYIQDYSGPHVPAHTPDACHYARVCFPYLLGLHAFAYMQA